MGMGRSAGFGACREASRSTGQPSLDHVRQGYVLKFRRSLPPGAIINGRLEIYGMTDSPEAQERQALVWDIGTGRPVTPIAERRSYAEPYDRTAFTLVTRSGREMLVSLAVQPVFDLARSTVVARRLRRSVRHHGAPDLARRGLQPADLKRIDLQTLKSGLELLGASGSAVVPAFWRTVAASPGHFALLCEELRSGAASGALLVEVVGNVDHAPEPALRATMPAFETDALAMALHITPDIGTARRMSALKPQCLAIDFAGVEQEGSRAWQGAAQLIGAARAASGQVLLLNLRPDRGLAAEAAGATHAVFADMQAIRV
jgi:hypothetical protein